MIHASRVALMVQLPDIGGISSRFMGQSPKTASLTTDSSTSYALYMYREYIYVYMYIGSFDISYAATLSFVWGEKYPRFEAGRMFGERRRN